MISLNGISFSYSRQSSGCLQDIDMNIQAGECILLCGRSGCGKTTILRMINGLIPYFYSGDLNGTVTVDGMKIGNVPMYEIGEKVGSVFQNPRTQFFNVDTDSEIAFGIENEALPLEELKQRVNTTTKDLQIEYLRGRNIFEFSGGEKQKIAFASIYAMNPDIYILDEPSSNLDMTAIQKLKEHLSIIKKQGKTIVIAEHKLYYLMDLADKILYLNNGKIDQTFTSDSFSALPDDRRKQMGLRAVDLQYVHPFFSNYQKGHPILEIKDVTLCHKKRMILEHINVEVGEGEVIAVVGHNGAGKTTFSRAVCGLHREFDGMFLLHGKPQKMKDRLKYSYMVMQDVNYELFAESVKAECSFGIKNPDYTLVEKTMDELGLTPYRDRHPNTLSGGQKQRTAVAVSMICKKKVLVFDEPTSGLDYDSMIQVSELIHKLSEMKKIIFVVTHDYEFVCRTCLRILDFDNGKITEDLVVNKENEDILRELFEVENSTVTKKG